MKNFWKKYLYFLDTKPIITKSCTASLLFLVGDGIAQKLIQKKEKYDFKRSIIYGTFGLAVFGPINHRHF